MGPRRLSDSCVKHVHEGALRLALVTDAMDRAMRNAARFLSVSLVDADGFRDPGQSTGSVQKRKDNARGRSRVLSTEGVVEETIVAGETRCLQGR